MLKLSAYLLLIISSLFFFSCQKEYSVEVPPAVTETAVYAFTGTPGACSNALVDGIYQTGKALTAANKATITVEVSKAGTYIIATEAVNGISFKGKGSFTTTGIQVIELTGSGTPLADGTFNYTPAAGSCSFSIVVLGINAATAVFTYGGAPGACNTGDPKGIFMAGAALTASNTIVIGVSVSTIGVYTIATPVVNGFSFVGSGNFTTTGAQSVTLTGTGTPGAAGVSTFTFPNNGCSFTVTVLPSGGGSANNDIYYEATIDGVYYKQIVTETNGYMIGTGSKGDLENKTLSSIISPIADPYPAGATAMDIDKGVLHNFLDVTPAIFKNFFTPGIYPYASSLNEDGAGVGWVDPSGNYWSSSYDPGTQTGSLFNLVSVEEVVTPLGYYLKLTATFNCKLYDIDGNVKTLTNGKFVGTIGGN